MDKQAESSGGSLLGFYNMFTGGALLKGAVFALGIMPYISASIIMQLAGAVVPWIARLQQEGDVGRQKISQYTRYLTIIICLVQSILLLMALSTNPGSLIGQGEDFITNYGKDHNFGQSCLVPYTLNHLPNYWHCHPYVVG